jgi:hypothetical protein
LGGIRIMPAHMDPEDIQNYKHTKSEAYFYEKLHEQLSEKFHCFFSIRWFDKVNGKRIDSECDFLVFDPGFGFLTIEVKGGIKIDIDAHKRWILTEPDEEGNISTRELKESPFAQAEKSMRYFYDNFSSEYLQTFNGAYGFAVCFPFYKVDEKIEDAADKNLIIDARHIDGLAHRINEIFHYWKSKNNTVSPFSSEQKRKFISMVHKQISLSAAAGALIPLKEKELEKINLVQDSIVDFLSNYNQVQIIGGAGTGKTYMAIKKIRREKHNGRKLLYLCKNHELADFVANEINDSDVDCWDFVSYIEKLLNRPIETVESVFDEISKAKHESYDVIVVDEAQDFSIDEAFAIRQLLKDEQKSVLYVFLDENQNLFNVDFDSAFAIDTKPYILRYNIRNTGEIYRYASESTGLGAETKANNLLGVVPEIRKTKNRVQTISTVASIINRLVQKECVSTKSIVILSDLEYNKSALAGETQIGAYNINIGETPRKDEEIMFRTVAEYKGLESDVVVYVTSPEHALIDERARKKEDYVAYTRARYYLYLVEQK